MTPEERIEQLENAIRDLAVWVDAVEGVSLEYFMQHSQSQDAKKVIAEVCGYDA